MSSATVAPALSEEDQGRGQPLEKSTCAFIADSTWERARAFISVLCVTGIIIALAHLPALFLEQHIDDSCGQPGYFSAPTAHPDCYACPHESCFQDDDTTCPCLGTSCMTGTTGVLCAQCESGYYPAQGRCWACSQTDEASSIVISTVIFAVVFVLIIVGGSVESLGAFKVLVENAMLLALTQNAMFRITLPELGEFRSTYEKFSSWFASIGVLSPTCWSDDLSGWYTQFVLAVCTVPAVLLFLFLHRHIVECKIAGCAVFGVDGMYGEKERKSRSQIITWKRYAFTSLGIVYVPITTTLLEAFDCAPYKDPARVLSADSSIICDDPAHKIAQGVAALALACFSVGLPVWLYGAMSAVVECAGLYRNKKVKGVFGLEQSNSAYPFHETFHSNYANFEVLQLCRKLCLVVASASLAAYPKIFATICLMTSSVYLVVFAWCRPFRPMLTTSFFVACGGKRFDFMNTMELISASLLWINHFVLWIVAMSGHAASGGGWLLVTLNVLGIGTLLIGNVATLIVDVKKYFDHVDLQDVQQTKKSMDKVVTKGPEYAKKVFDKWDSLRKDAMWGKMQRDTTGKPDEYHQIQPQDLPLADEFHQSLLRLRGLVLSDLDNSLNNKATAPGEVRDKKKELKKLFELHIWNFEVPRHIQQDSGVLSTLWQLYSEQNQQIKAAHDSFRRSFDTLFAEAYKEDGKVKLSFSEDLMKAQHKVTKCDQHLFVSVTKWKTSCVKTFHYRVAIQLDYVIRLLNWRRKQGQEQAQALDVVKLLDETEKEFNETVTECDRLTKSCRALHSPEQGANAPAEMQEQSDGCHGSVGRCYAAAKKAVCLNAPAEMQQQSDECDGSVGWCYAAAKAHEALLDSMFKFCCECLQSGNAVLAANSSIAYDGNAVLDCHADTKQPGWFRGMAKRVQRAAECNPSLIIIKKGEKGVKSLNQLSAMHEAQILKLLSSRLRVYQLEITDQVTEATHEATRLLQTLQDAVKKCDTKKQKFHARGLHEHAKGYTAQSAELRDWTYTASEDVSIYEGLKDMVGMKSSVLQGDQKNKAARERV